MKTMPIRFGRIFHVNQDHLDDLAKRPQAEFKALKVKDNSMAAAAVVDGSPINLHKNYTNTMADKTFKALNQYYQALMLRVIPHSELFGGYSNDLPIHAIATNDDGDSTQLETIKERLALSEEMKDYKAMRIAWNSRHKDKERAIFVEATDSPVNADGKAPHHFYQVRGEGAKQLLHLLVKEANIPLEKGLDYVA